MATTNLSVQRPCHHPLRRDLLLSAIGVATFALSEPLSGQNPVELRDVPYVRGGHHEQRLDLFLPTSAGFATVVFIHGGSLRESGERRDSVPYRGICQPFVAAKIACATVDYRLAPSFQWPAMPEDVAAAVRLVRDSVVARGGNPRGIVLFGHSSGCHLAAMLGTDERYLRRVGLATSDLAGVVAMGCTLNPRDTTGRGFTPTMLRAAFESDEGDRTTYGTVDRFLGANPSFYLGKHVPPTLVVVAMGERFMPPILEQGARFVRRMLELDLAADLVIVPGTHMSSVAGVVRGDATFDVIRTFVDGVSRRKL